ncbi:hypothetical protein GCM10008171_05190 [Methylopila jiangsuensis]|uniref:PepSY domain-containing protein n=1 Tax=Methylopila jiangsuensis TaxID=586230 RepID=A0A9W6N2G4_9HYPH|nr:PepSY domain-containing protein [Methylopila jiangsuensis]MDR6285507.1 hypothetical protein [Methylopila jiangsuensis]GLK75265.1 hypothetical protein GCM10008171_05190 [Methylopila jiangsuensis]
MRIAPNALLAAAFVLVAGAAQADSVGPDWITMEQAAKKARDAGYTAIFKIEADDGHWEVTGLRDGRRVEADIHPTTGALSNERPDD